MSARKDLHSHSLETLRARVAENPKDGTARRRLVDAALKAGAADEAVEVAAEGARLVTIAPGGFVVTAEGGVEPVRKPKPQFRGKSDVRSQSGVGGFGGA